MSSPLRSQSAQKPPSQPQSKSYVGLVVLVLIIIGLVALAAYLIGRARFNSLPRNNIRDGSNISIQSSLLDSEPMTIDFTNCNFDNNSSYVRNACMMTFTGRETDSYITGFTKSQGNKKTPNISARLNNGFGNAFYLTSTGSTSVPSTQLVPVVSGQGSNVEFIVSKRNSSLGSDEPGEFAPYFSQYPDTNQVGDVSSSTPVYRMLFAKGGVNYNNCDSSSNCPNDGKIRLWPGLEDINTATRNNNNGNPTDIRKPALAVYPIDQGEQGEDGTLLDYLFVVKELI